MDILNKIKSFIKDKDVFLSFRNSINVSLINPNNSFNTPTGIYTYPSSDYRSKILKSNTMEEFYEIFPFKGRYDPKHLYIYELKPKCVVFDNNTTLSELKPYYEKIMKLYSTDEYRKLTFDYLKDYINGIQKDPEKELYGYRLFFNYDIRDEKGSEIYKFWTLTYNLTDDEPNVWGNLFRKIGIDAFVDHGEGYIHPNEPHQGLLLKSRGIFQDITVIDLIDDNKSKNEIKKDLSENKNPPYNDMIDCYQKDPGFVLSILLNYAKKLNFEVVNHYEDVLKDSRNKKTVDDILTYYYNNFTIENSLDLFRHHDILKLWELYTY